MVVLSKYSMHVPRKGECQKCKFVNQCQCGELCKVHVTDKNKSCDRQTYEHERYLKKKALKMGVVK